MGQGKATIYSRSRRPGPRLEPFAYLHNVLQHIGAAETVEQIEALLPWNVQPKGTQEL